MKLHKKLLAATLALSLLLPLLSANVTAAGTVAYRWVPGQAMPTFSAPAGTLDAIDTRGLPFAETLVAACLQGIINRTQPRILIVNSDEGTRDSWRDILGLSYDVLASWQDGVRKYLGELNGVVIWNPAVQDTANVATTIAGVTDSLAVSPELAALLTAAPYSLPVTVDLRSELIADKIGAYRYLYHNYWNRCTRKTISGLVPDGHTNLRDFSVAVKAAVLWLDAGVPAERDVLKLFFKDTAQLDTFYTGWWPNEPKGIDFASAYGVMTVASDFYLNYTVYSGMSQRLSIPTVPAKPVLDNGKIYVSVLISDGDNIQYDQGAMLIDRLWGSPERGAVPIGWTATPVMLDAGPQILNYYYRTATPNDVLVCGPSGLGYSTSAQWPDKSFTQQYGKLTNAYFERSAFNIITVWHELGGQKADWFTGAMPSLLGLTTQGFSGLKIRHTESNVPVVWLGSDAITSIGGMSYESGVGYMKQHLSAAAKLPQMKAQFFAAQGNVWETSVSDFVRLRDELAREFPGKFEFVRPDHFMMLVNESYGKPYPAALQHAAAASVNSGGAGKAFDGSFTTGWEAPFSGEVTLQVDLGESYMLDRYVLKNAETNYLPSGLNTKAWQLQVSQDGNTWTTLDAVSNNGGGIVYRGLHYAAARYVRLLITDPGADSTARVQELEVFGVKTKDASFGKAVGNGFYDSFTKLVNVFFELFYRVVNWFKGIFG
ncbi:MAG: discoidin domain-containing protein [Oscillospiraceae bacterium]|jgi:hypothetical protein|nr:discoidin domain-containing protein [Oscillospiraceae bacterium]